MDHPARCGINGLGSITATPSQAQQSAVNIIGSMDASFDGYLGLPASLTVTASLLGLDSTQPFSGDVIAIPTDPVGNFSALGRLLGTDELAALTTALEFDNGVAGSGAVQPSDVSNAYIASMASIRF